MGWFRRNREIDGVKGEFGYFDLGRWWLESFTADEREHIETIYRPFGGGRDRPLTEGDVSFTTATAARLLYGLGG